MIVLAAGDSLFGSMREMSEFRIERDSMGEVQRAGPGLLRRSDAAGRRELPHLRLAAACRR